MIKDFSGEYILYDQEEEGVSYTICSKIGITIMSDSLQKEERLSHYHDIYYKNEIIKLLKQLAIQNNSAQIDRMKQLILSIHDISIYIHILDDCFQLGIDLSNTYTTILSICSQQIQNLKDETPSERKEVILKQLDYYSTVVSWFYRLLERYSSRQVSSIYITNPHDLADCCEILQISKLYEDQFLFSSSSSSSPTTPTTSFTYQDLPVFIQCIQSVCILSRLIHVSHLLIPYDMFHHSLKLHEHFLIHFFLIVSLMILILSLNSSLILVRLSSSHIFFSGFFNYL